MTTRLYDAHVHLADPQLASHKEEIATRYTAIQLSRAIVNGTKPKDWPDVLKYCATDRRLIPAIGLHPWHVPQAPTNWQKLFLQAFENGACAVGEIGLDRWIQGHDLNAQIPVFKFQLHYAATHNLPVSIHALQATGPLMDILRTSLLPPRGFHLHAYNGPIECLPELTDMGAYFSFNAAQFKNKLARQALGTIPHDRLLIETDAPNFLPPIHERAFILPNPKLNHPANLKPAYHAIAQSLQLQITMLAGIVEQNFKTYFLDPKT
jgi:TatD DNase family protein